MDRRYQIFVSSTFADLVDERKAVSQTLLSLNHFPAGMELFPASNDEQWTLIKGVIDDSDYYLIVIGGRYGSMTDQGLSFTEKEFDYAVAAGIPILAFVHGSPGDIAVKRTDESDGARQKLEAFRKKVMTGRTVKFWTTAENLSNAVFQAVTAETKKNPREGWVRARLSGDPAKLNELREQIDRLKEELRQGRTSPPTGAHLYAQGEETIAIHYEIEEADDPFPEQRECPMTWDQIFYVVGPAMMDEASEEKLRQRLADQIHEFDDNLGYKPDSSTVDYDTFETVKIQLVALGLIRQSEKRHVTSDRNVYWQLTPFGNQYLMGLRAIKKGVK